jgi:hypothetical protein
MGDSVHLSGLRSRYSGKNLAERPFFVGQQSWDIFTSFVTGRQGLEELATVHSFPLRRLRQIIRDVDRQLLLPRKSSREWREVTANSPLEDLGIPVRAVNQLRDHGCATVEDVLRLNLSHNILGESSRMEVVAALRRCGFAAAAGASATRMDLERVSEQLRELGKRIEENLRSWRQRVEGIEARLRRLNSEGAK